MFYLGTSQLVIGSIRDLCRREGQKTIRVKGDSEEKVFFRPKQDRYDYELTGAVTRCTEPV